MRDQEFNEEFNDLEKAAWLSFKKVCTYFEGIHRANHYSDIVKNLLTSYMALRCNMSLKIYLLNCHLHLIPGNLGGISDEHN